ncbi:MAG: transposase [Actinomycetota bacterium]|jgi:transposase|nr:transposase [Actinomycetota bacterium]MDX6263312.1 transposase [Kribbellaceae bacterium]
MRELAQRIQLLVDQLARTKVRLRRITTAVAPDLVARKGVGPDTASTILVSAGDNPHRLRYEHAFASLAGANPIPASSGKTTRHRLNRGGDRQLNLALWRITMVRLATDDDTRAYLERRVSEGKTKIEGSGASSATSRAKSSRRYPKRPPVDSRSIGHNLRLPGRRREGRRPPTLRSVECGPQQESRGLGR